MKPPGEGGEEEGVEEERGGRGRGGVGENTFIFTCQHLKTARKFLPFAGDSERKELGTGSTY